MHVQRFLGAEWASVHGPKDPKRLLIWVLEARFAGLMAAPGPRSLVWKTLADAARDLPFEFAAVRAGSALASTSATAGLAATKDGERLTAARAVHEAVATARQLGCRLVVFEPGVVPVLGEIDGEDLGDPALRWTAERAQGLLARRRAGRNAALDRACREVYSLVKSFPDIEFCLSAGRSLRAVADRAGLLDLFEDLHQLPLFYWHDAAVCARREQVLGEAQGEWLETFANRCRGFSLGDASEAGVYLPPGAGGVDYALLAAYVRRTGAPTPAVLELDPSVPPGEFGGMRACLDQYGL